MLRASLITATPAPDFVLCGHPGRYTHGIIQRTVTPGAGIVEQWVKSPPVTPVSYQTNADPME